MDGERRRKVSIVVPAEWRAEVSFPRGLRGIVGGFLFDLCEWLGMQTHVQWFRAGATPQEIVDALTVEAITAPSGEVSGG